MRRLLRLSIGLFFPLLALVSGCSRLEPPGPQQALIVGLTADPAFLQAAPNEGMNGFTQDLTSLFAESMDAGVRYVTAPDYPSLLTMLREGRVHMAATVPILGNDPELRFSPPLRETRQYIVRHASALPLDSPAALAGREIAVLPGVPQIQTLQNLHVSPPPIIVEREGIDEIELLARVARRRDDLAASDDLHLAVASNAYPDLDVAFTLPGKLAYGWVFHADEHVLLDKATRFIEAAQQDGMLRRFDDRYFGHIRRLNTRDITGFLENIQTRLPDYRFYFQEAQEITGIDWRLLAAVAYQESKWDPLATSPTGVRGMMMLTEDTADRLQVTNRLDPWQSIRAGAIYLDMLMADLPDEIKPPDRLWFALAAYNLGMGHLGGGRQFAPGLNRNPNLWVDMKQVLPLLAQPQYYNRLKSGRARGGEAVIMVENIRNYYDTLCRLEAAYVPPSPSADKPVKKKTKRKPARPAKPAPKPAKPSTARH